MNLFWQEVSVKKIVNLWEWAAERWPASPAFYSFLEFIHSLHEMGWLAHPVKGPKLPSETDEWEGSGEGAELQIAITSSDPVFDSALDAPADDADCEYTSMKCSSRLEEFNPCIATH